MMLGENSVHDADAMSAPMMHTSRTVCIRLTPDWAGGIKKFPSLSRKLQSVNMFQSVQLNMQSMVQIHET